MFIFDDILFSPFNGFMWIVKEIHKAATEEMKAEAEQLTQRLTGLYRQLEAGEITEEAFAEQEESILERLEEMAELATQGGAIDDDDEEDDDQEEGEDEEDAADEDDAEEASEVARDEVEEERER